MHGSDHVAQGKKAIVKKADEANEESKRRAGFLLSRETDYKLSLYARKHHKDRSTVVEETLERKLRHVVISFRAEASEEGEAA